MIIAERMLKLRGASEDVPVPVRIFAPRQDNDAWACRWEIHWPDRQRASEMFGFDSTQSLILALQTVGSELYASNEHKSGRLSWFESRTGYGFPVPPNLRHILAGDDEAHL
jgi:hypothetical protein